MIGRLALQDPDQCASTREEAAQCQKSLVDVSVVPSVSLNVGVPSDSVTITGESLATYEDRSGASGKPFYRTFCSKCGSPISGRGAAYSGLTFLKAGTLDDSSWVKPDVHVWCSEKQPWVMIEQGVAQTPRNAG